MNAYHNMSAPPRTTVCQQVKPVGRQVVFSIYEIDFSYGDDAHKTFPPPRDFSSPQEWLDDFLKSHKAELESIRRPTGFMIGAVCKGGDGGKLYNGATAKDVYELCKDPILSISVLGRIAGNIYIPHRQVALGAWFDKGEYYIFPARYFTQP